MVYDVKILSDRRKFQILVGKNHPDIFSLISEFKKEQTDIEIQVVELSVGRRVKSAPKKKRIEIQARIRSIVES